VGYGYDVAVAAMQRWGIGELAIFEGRERRTEPLAGGVSA
jgi:hypothetical protein